MKALTSLRWGASRTTLLKFYNIYIRPKIDYGITIYGAAADSQLEKIQKLQNEAMRIATGCFRSTPIPCLQALTSLLPLKQRMQEIDFIEFSKILEKPDTRPVKQCLVKDVQRKTKPSRRLLAHRVAVAYADHRLPVAATEIPDITPIPPWRDISGMFILRFGDDLTRSTPRQVVQRIFAALERETFQGHHIIFTDGSKSASNLSSSAAIYIQDGGIATLWKLPRTTEVAESELFGIRQALQYVLNNNLRQTVIFTDSKTALHLILNSCPRRYRGTIFAIQALILTLMNRGLSVTFHWIPAHKGIHGNEIADSAAKKAHSLPRITGLAQDIGATKKNIRTSCTDTWEKGLEAHLATRDYLIKSPKPMSYQRSRKRKLDVAIARILTRHTRLRHHMKRLNMEPDASCRWCAYPEETLQHLLLHCVRFLTPRTALRDALKSRKIKDPPSLELLLTGNNLPPATKAFVLRHTKIFLLRTKLVDIL